MNKPTIALSTLVFFISIANLPNLYAIFHAYSHSFTTEKERIKWLLLSVFLPVIGGIIYILFGRKRALKQENNQ